MNILYVNLKERVDNKSLVESQVVALPFSRCGYTWERKVYVVSSDLECRINLWFICQGGRRQSEESQNG
jgi:hypothetical protein